MKPIRQAKGKATPSRVRDGADQAPVTTSVIGGNVATPPVKSVDIAGKAEPPETKPATIEEKQEKTRGAIAGALVALLFIIIIASFAAVWLKVQTVAEVKALLEVILAPVVALVGSATGFYFGGRKK